MSTVTHGDIHAEVERQVNQLKFELQQEQISRHSNDVASITSQAADYRKGLLWFSGTVGGILLGALATWAVFMIEERVNVRVDTTLETVETDLREELMEIISDEIGTAMQLTLIFGSMASVVDQRTNYNTTSSVTDALIEISDDVLNLGNVERTFAFNQIEGWLDAMLFQGQYGDILDIYRAYGPDLLQDDGIYFTIAHAAASVVILQGGSQMAYEPEVEQLRLEIVPFEHLAHFPMQFLEFTLLVRADNWDQESAMQAAVERVSNGRFHRHMEMNLNLLEDLIGRSQNVPYGVQSRVAMFRIIAGCLDDLTDETCQN